MEGKVPHDRGRIASDNPFDSLGEEEAGQLVNTNKKPQQLKKTKKVKYSPWEFFPTLFENGPQLHAGKYLVVETTAGPKLTDLSVFTVEAVLHQIALNYISADRIRDGKILLLTKDQKSVKNALTMTEIKGICKIKVTEHNESNE
jgi:hypothetical protein